MRERHASASAHRWRPSLGAVPAEQGFRFRVWAPEHERVELLIDPQGPAHRSIALARAPGGWFETEVSDLAAGVRYAYALDGQGPFPDPVSRFQPEGVHGPSELVDPRSFQWTDEGWRGVALRDAVIYELHVGTFTTQGTFRAAIERLDALAELGVTVVELMPIADFPGNRNWGYDGVSLFAPARCYGRPDDLRALVDEAHRRRLAVILDVVYNHFGPDGAYFMTFSPHYVSTRHHTPWGAAVNFDGPHAGPVRQLFIENALYWLHEFHLDGLRFDATHGLIDDGPRHLLAEMAERIREACPEREALLIAEDERNLRTLIDPPEAGGYGLDAVWADDFHHQVRRHVVGDRDGYYADFSGSVGDLAKTIERGWFFTGQHSSYLGRPRGTDPAGLPLRRMVICLQNHDQIGNRPFGDRLHHQTAPAVWRAATALLLAAPETPLLFMGQEWSASTPFLFFTDHLGELGTLVTEGRRREFGRFTGFADPERRAQIPDPQADSTFERSRLRWDERDLPDHVAVLALNQALIALRRQELAGDRDHDVEVLVLGEHTLALRRPGSANGRWLIVVHLDMAPATLRLRDACLDAAWKMSLSTEEPRFADADEGGARPIQVEANGADLVLSFDRAGAVFLQSE